MDNFEIIDFTDDEDELTFYDDARPRFSNGQCTLMELAKLAIAKEKVRKAFQRLHQYEYVWYHITKTAEQKKNLPYRIKIAKLKYNRAHDNLDYLTNKIRTNIMYRNNHNLYLSDSD